MKNIDVLISEKNIALKVKQLGKIISKDYMNKDLLVLGILNGCFIFTSDLVRQLTVENIEIRFVRLKSYEDTKSTGQVNINFNEVIDFEGKNVLIVEDIVDTGITISKFKEKLMLENPNSVKIAALLNKKARRIVAVEPDYYCFDIPDEFAVGYGLDYNEKYRNLAYIGVLNNI